MNLQYCELIHSKETTKLGYRSGYCFDNKDIERLYPSKPHFGYHANDPLCPNCETHLIYKFEHCPKCGQTINWEVGKENKE